ncbi:MAG: hypothetical protein QOJ72_2047 [Nocardioidaceae bacterium]|nr:hypothetical protein [Nocardioidaceae bacterium]
MGVIASRIVLVAPLRSSLGLSGSHDGLPVADIRHPDAVETMLAGFMHGGDTPIVTCSVADVEEVRTLLSYTSVRIPGFRAALEPLPGTPLAVGVVSSLADDLTDPDGDTLAWQISALDYLRARIWSAVWLPRVSGLTTPAPSLFQHMRSWLPGSGFLAVHGDGTKKSGRVLNARHAPVTGLDPRPDVALLHSTLQHPTWIVPAVATALAAQSVSDVSTVREQIDTYGTTHAVELLGVPASFHADTKPDPQSISACNACGTRHARTACPLCGMTVTAASLVPLGEHS